MVAQKNKKVPVTLGKRILFPLATKANITTMETMRSMCSGARSG